MSRHEEEGSLVPHPTLAATQASPAPAQALAPTIEIEDVVHAIESFKAVIRPVAVCMLLVSWAVVNVVRRGVPQQSKLLVFDEGADVKGGASAGTMIVHSLANSLAIIASLASRHSSLWDATSANA